MKNSFALVTGATSEIGKHISSTLADLGFNLILHYHLAKNEAEQLKEYIEKQQKVKCSIICSDLSSNSNNLIQQITEIGQLKVIVNNASIFSKDTLENVDENNLNLNMAFNLNAPLFLTQMLLSTIKSQNKTNENAAIIINILDSSVFSNKMKKHFSYLLAKKGLFNLTQTIASNIDSKLLRCNAIAIGRFLNSEHSEHCTANDIINTIRFIIQTEALNGNIICLDNGSFLN